MKKRIASSTSALVILLLWVLCGAVAASGSERKVTILFTHDLHSYLLPFRAPDESGGSSEHGGYAGLESLIKKNRACYGNASILVDAGDMSMGTLFHAIFAKEAPELRLMGRMGYDVATFGNHEFDFHAEGLAAMLEKAAAGKGRLPEIVSSNAVFKPVPESESLKRVFRTFPVKSYTVLERNGVRIGVFGVLGKDAAGDMASAAEMAFADPIETARKITEILRNREKADLVVCLSHSGTSRIKKYSEDEKLAREVPGIDVIISAHTHTVLPRPIIAGKTIIASSGCYGSYLGVLELACSGGTGMRLVNYSLQPVSAEASGDPSIAASLESYKKDIERQYLSLYGYRFDQVIARSGFNMEPLDSIYARQRETGLGNLVADSYRDAVRKAEGKRYDYMHVVLQPIGTIRDSILKGDITVADVFRVLSLGLGEDGRPGYPLISYYVNGKELKSLLEVHTSVAPFKPGAAMQLSGVRFTYNPNRVPFERVTSVLVRDAGGIYRPPDAKRLYRICANIYTARRIDYIRKVSHGLIDLLPKDKTGREVEDLKQAIIHARSQDGQILEVKEWTALAGFLAGFPDKDSRGIPQIPETYRGPDGRITVDASWNPVKLMSAAGPITYTLAGVLLVILILLAWLIQAVYKRVLPKRKI